MSELLIAILIVLTTEAYIWVFAPNGLWFVLIPIALLLVLWRKQQQTPATLGLALSECRRAFRQWRWLWLITVALFLLLVVRRAPVPQEAAGGVLTAFLIALFVYRMPVQMAALAFANGRK